MEIATFLPRAAGMLKAIGQPLGTAKRVKESRWDIPKCLPSANRRDGRIAQQKSEKHGNFHSFS
jgi:hypothetical protein